MEQLSPDDRNVVGRARRLERFLTQPFFATEQFSGIKGKDVSLKDALDGCERILNDEFKDYPGERALHDRSYRRKAKVRKSRPEPLTTGAIGAKVHSWLKVLLPFQIFIEKKGVKRIVAKAFRAPLDSCRTDSTARRPWRRGF